MNGGPTPAPPATLIVIEVTGPEHTQDVARDIVDADHRVKSATPAYGDGFGRIVQIPLQAVTR